MNFESQMPPTYQSHFEAKKSDIRMKTPTYRKFSVNPWFIECQGAWSISLKVGVSGNRKISFLGRECESLILNFPRPLVCPIYTRLAAL